MESLKEFKKKYGKISKAVSKRGDRIYQQIKDKLEKDYKGKFIIIEPDSGEYFVGDDELELVKIASKKFPDKIFNMKKVGYRAAGFLRKKRRVLIWYQRELSYS